MIVNLYNLSRTLWNRNFGSQKPGRPQLKPKDFENPIPLPHPSPEWRGAERKTDKGLNLLAFKTPAPVFISKFNQLKILEKLNNLKPKTNNQTQNRSITKICPNFAPIFSRVLTTSVLLEIRKRNRIR